MDPGPSDLQGSFKMGAGTGTGRGAEGVHYRGVLGAALEDCDCGSREWILTSDERNKTGGLRGNHSDLGKADGRRKEKYKITILSRHCNSPGERKKLGVFQTVWMNGVSV